MKNVKNVWKQKHFALNGESSVTEVLRKTFLRNLVFCDLLFVCKLILAGFSFGRRILDEHTPLKAFFLQPSGQLSFL